MATNLEDKLISAVLKDAQIHVLLQADATKLFRTHGDVWEFVSEVLRAEPSCAYCESRQGKVY